FFRTMIIENSFVAGLQYLPSIEFFARWLHHGTLFLEKHENYQKRTWRNKTAILGPEKPVLLSIPLRKGKNQGKLITSVEISYDEPWERIHMGSLQTAYGKTAFFEEFESTLNSIFIKQHKYLWEMNMEFLLYLISFFPGECKIDYTKTYEPILPDHILDLRSGIPAGSVSMKMSSSPMYQQIHRLANSHLPNLSILDVLCHLGPGTYEYLQHYAVELYK